MKIFSRNELASSSRGRLLNLISFEGSVTAADQAFGAWMPEREEGGVLRAAHYRATRAGESFVRMACLDGWVLDFDWDRWSRSRDGQRYFDQPDLIAAADLDDLARIITVCVKGTSLSEDFLEEMRACGVLEAVVAKARCLFEAMTSREPAFA